MPPRMERDVLAESHSCQQCFRELCEGTKVWFKQAQDDPDLWFIYCEDCADALFKGEIE